MVPRVHYHVHKNPLFISAQRNVNPDHNTDILFHSWKIILEAFAKPRQKTISFIMSVCLSVRPSIRPSVCMEQLGSHWTSFIENRYFTIFWEFVKKIKVLLKSKMTNGTLQEDQYIYRSVLLRVKNVSDKRCRENPNTHFVFNNMSFEIRAVYEIMWKILYKRTGQRQRNTAHANRMLYN